MSAAILEDQSQIAQAQKTIQLPTALIHPIVFVPGFANTLPFPPTYDQTDPWATAFLANWVAEYNTLRGEF